MGKIKFCLFWAVLLIITAASGHVRSGMAKTKHSLETQQDNPDVQRDIKEVSAMHARAVDLRNAAINGDESYIRFLVEGMRSAMKREIDQNEKKLILRASKNHPASRRTTLIERQKKIRDSFITACQSDWGNKTPELRRSALTSFILSMEEEVEITLAETGK